MKLKDFISMLSLLEVDGHGDKEVLYRHGSSGDCGPLSTAWVTNHIDECGPFDIEDGEEYISISAGY